VDQTKNMPGLSHDFSHFCLDLFYDLGVRTIFTIPGAHIEHFILAAAKDNRFKLIVSAHEEGAGFMADGYFRKSKNVTLVATINGPGLTNLITAVSTAMIDHSSIIYLTGDVPSSIKNKLGFQTSFQDGCNSSELMKLLIGQQIIPMNSNQLYYSLKDYYSSFINGMNYPLHINVHNDVFSQPILEKLSFNELKYNKQYYQDLRLDELSFNHSVVILGEDISDSDDLNAIVQLCKTFTIPIVCTLGAKNVQAYIPKALFCGVYGYAGNDSAIQLLADNQIETIYFIGAELTERNTMAWSSKLFKKNRTIYSISNRPEKNGILEHPIHYIHGSIKPIVESILERSLKVKQVSWFESYRYQSPEVKWFDENRILNMEVCLLMMNRMINKSSNFFLDSGDHRIYGSQLWDVTHENTFFTAAKNAPMGWAIAAGIGASFVDNSIATWILTGDGCMLMHGNELAVARRYQCNTKFVVINNGSYGRIELRLNQEDDLIRNQIARLPSVSWTQYANSFNIEAICVRTVGELERAINAAQHSDQAFLIEVMIPIVNEGTKSETIFSSSSQSFKPFWKEE
jgi:acetolactate synthase-1/2/3 large subunit